MVLFGGTLLHRTKVRTVHRDGLSWLRTAIALGIACSDFRDEVGVVLGGHRSALQRHHGDAAVNMVVHTAMAAMLVVLLTTRLLMAAMVVEPMPLLLGAARRHGGDLL